jgi:hypothetical protein
MERESGEREASERLDCMKLFLLARYCGSFGGGGGGVDASGLILKTFRVEKREFGLEEVIVVTHERASAKLATPTMVTAFALYVMIISQIDCKKPTSQLFISLGLSRSTQSQ